MIPIFLGLTIANLLLLTSTVLVGLYVTDALDQVTGVYGYHLAMGIFATMFAAFTHVAVFTYFMATSKWLHAATDRLGLAMAKFVEPAQRRKSKAFAVGMMAAVVTMMTAFAGAGADPTARPLWPSNVHLIIATLAVAANAYAARRQYDLIRDQGAAVDEAAALLAPGAGASPSAADAPAAHMSPPAAPNSAVS